MLIGELDHKVPVGLSHFMNRSFPIKSKKRKKKHKKGKREKWPPFLHFHIGDLHTRRWTWTWLGGRRTWLGGRLEPLREFGILPFLLGGLAGITCVVMWVHESLQGSKSLPLRVVGSQSLTLKHATGFCVWLTHEQWLGSVKAWEAWTSNSMCCRHLLDGSAWESSWAVCLRAQVVPSFPTELAEGFQSEEEENKL